MNGLKAELATDQVKQIAKQLTADGQTVSVAESSAGGLISASLLAVAGASAYYRGGSVVYTLASRRELIGLRRQDVEGLEPLSEAMAMRFAEVCREQLNATWGIAELGIAGPDGSHYGHSPGLCVIAIDGPVRLSTTLETGCSDRAENMWRFAAEALDLLRQAIVNSVVSTAPSARPSKIS